MGPSDEVANMDAQHKSGNLRHRRNDDILVYFCIICIQKAAGEEKEESALYWEQG